MSVFVELFAKKVIREMWEFGELDGGWIQDTAVEYGVLVPVTVTEPCSEDYCVCAEVNNEFPATCYRFADEPATA